jgi:hypothetical protein
MKTPDEFRHRAERYRRLKPYIRDPIAIQAISDLAAEFEMTAEELERRQRIRERAHEIWIECGCPEGRDVEFWLAAEREIDSLHDYHGRRA